MKLLQRWKQTALHNKALVMTSVLVAFGTLFYAGAAAFQVWLMKQTSKDSAAQVERLVGTTNAAINKAVGASGTAITEALRQNKQAMDAAMSQSKAALDASTKQSKAALDATVEQSNLDRRSWIAPMSAGLVGGLVAGRNARLGVQYANVGREPALDVRPIYKFQRVPTSTFADNTFNGIIERDDICKEVRTAPGADVIYPQQPQGYRLIFELPATFITDDIINGTTLLVFRMCFAYASIGKTHHASFCYFYRSGVSTIDQWNICTAGNHTD